MENKVNNKETWLDITELSYRLVRNIGVLLVCAAAAGLAAFLIAYFFMPMKYDSYTTIYVRSDQTEDGRNNDISLAEIRVSQSLFDTYVFILTSDAVMDAVGSRLAENHDMTELAEYFSVSDGVISTNSIKKAFTVTSVDETEVIKISARTGSPEMSAELCRIMAEVAPEFLGRVAGAGRVATIDMAKVWNEPVGPNLKNAVLLGLNIGYTLSAALIFFLFLFERTVKSSEELSKRLDGPIIGEVYDFSQEMGKVRKKSKKQGNDEGDAVLLSDDTVFTIAESYKTMRTNSQFVLSQSHKKVFALTSANASEGKSTTAANLAIAFSQTDSRVLLIDADMRKPVQHRRFGISNDAGLSSAVGGMSTPKESIHREVRPGLDVMTAGPIPPNPSELLASERFGKLIGELEESYDIVIMDTPPVNVVSDVLVMSGFVAGVMLVLRHGSTTYDSAERAVEKLRAVDMRLLGFILNGIKVSHAGKYYRSYYHYRYDEYIEK